MLLGNMYLFLSSYYSSNYIFPGFIIMRPWTVGQGAPMCPLTLEQKFPSILQHSQLSYKTQVDTRDDDKALDCWTVGRTMPMCPLTLEQKFPSILQHFQLSYKAQVDTRDDDETSDCWTRTMPMCPLTLELKSIHPPTPPTVL